MGVIILFVAMLAAFIVWWLSTQRLTAKPWLEEGPIGEFPGTGALFALMLTAYVMRMQLADWTPLPKLNLLWVNTGVLILSSVGLQWARDASVQEDMYGVKVGLLAGGVAAIAFIAGQILAWRQLVSAGYFVATSPASSFFYLITATHGLHLLGGLAALGRTVGMIICHVAANEVRLSVELCTIYWHLLLLIWLLCFSLLLLT